MGSVRYAERAATLLNARLESSEDLRDFLTDRDSLVARVTEADGQALRRFQRDLHPVFERAANGKDVSTVADLNDLLLEHRITPHIAEDGAGSWQLVVSDGTSSVTELLVAEALLELAFVACDLGPDRLGTCKAAACDAVYVDTSPNRSRRYCSDRCSSRANVAAYRARRKVAAANGGDR